MDPITADLIKYLIKTMDGIANVVFVGQPAAAAAVQAETDALRKMIDEGRSPTDAEWAAHDASMSDLKNRLHN